MRENRPDADALDAYSTVVTMVAHTVLPSVASISVRSRRGNGGGSASVITSDGLCALVDVFVVHRELADS